MMTLSDVRPDPVLLQRLISAKLWELRKATAACDELAARRADGEVADLLDQLAACMIGEAGSWERPAVPQAADFNHRRYHV